MLSVLRSDSVDFVRQGAYIATALVYGQAVGTSSFRDELVKVISDKHQETLAKVGAVLAQGFLFLKKGIIDAGGRNVRVALLTDAGHPKMQAIVGMLLFTQFWDWYPLSHFLCLSFSPTALLGLNADLQVCLF